MSPEQLNPEHQVIAERARHHIACLIAGVAVAREIERPMPDIGMEDDYIS